MQNVLLPLLLSAPLAAAQQASSPGFQLLDVAFENAAAGAASPSFTAHVSIGDVQGQDAMSSPGFTAEVGFLEAYDPDPGQAPLAFEVEPSHGPKEGGTVLTIRGAGFTKFGGGPSTQVLVGGQPATGVTFLSDLELTCVTPPGAMGRADVVVSNVHGAAALGNAFVFEPALLATATAPIGGTHVLRNLGQPGALCATSFAATQTSIPLAGLGTLLIGPTATVEIIHGVPYPAGGELVHVFPIPDNPAFAGVTLYFQSAEVVLVPQIAIQLTNSDSMLLL